MQHYLLDIYATVGSYAYQQCKNFENRLRFDEVIVKVCQHPF